MLAILFNCSEPEAITLARAKIAANAEFQKRLKDARVLLGAYANRLTQVDPNWTLEGSEAPQPFRSDLDERQYWDEFVKLWVDDLNVQLVGGCCGITPEHIAVVNTELKKRRDNGQV